MNWDVLGHEWAARLLQQHITRQETRHAYLFTGPAGIGRRTLALRFAQALNCLQPPAPGEPCGTCRACLQIDRQQHPDLNVIQAETVGGILKVDAIRDLQRQLSLAPYEARYRVALLLRFQEANANAQNALLKTLEEAPAKAVLLLTADSADILLPTIASRCEILRLRPLPVESLEEALQTRWKMPREEAQRLAHLSGGRIGYALGLHENPDQLNQRLEWVADGLQLARASRRERFAYAEDAAKNKDNLRELFAVWQSLWRDILLSASSANAPLVNLDYQEDIQRLAEEIDPRSARLRVTALEKALEQLDANLNPRLLTEVTLLDWPRF